MKIVDNRRFTHFLPWWLLFFTWGSPIAWLSLTPTPPVIKNLLLGSDKFQHLAAYGMLTLLGGRAFGGIIDGRIRSWLIAAVVAAAFGILMEIAQLIFARNRIAAIGDVLAGVTGAAAGYLFFRFRDSRS